MAWASGVWSAAQSSQGQRGWVGNTVFAGFHRASRDRAGSTVFAWPAGWGWKHGSRSVSLYALAAQFSQRQRGGVGQHSIPRVSQAEPGSGIEINAQSKEIIRTYVLPDSILFSITSSAAYTITSSVFSLGSA